MHTENPYTPPQTDVNLVEEQSVIPQLEGKNLEMIQKQVNTQLYWNTSEEDVEVWLMSKHAIKGELAWNMVSEGLANRKIEIRKRSLPRVIIALVVAIPVIIITIVTLLLWGEEGLTIGHGAALGFACMCLLYAGKHLMHIITGKCDAPVESL